MRTSKALRWLGALLGAAIFGLVLHRLWGQWEEAAVAVTRMRWLPVLGAFGLYFLAQAVFAWSWHQLVHAEGESDTFGRDAARWCVSIAGKYLPGKVWHAAARIGLYRGSARSSRVAPAYLREMMLSLSAAMAWIGAANLPDSQVHPGFAWMFLLGAAGLLLASTTTAVRALLRLLRLALPWQLSVLDRGRRTVFLAWGAQLLAYGLFGAGLFLLGSSVQPLPAASFVPVVACLCFGGIAGIAAFFVPAGLGVREAALAWFLAPWLGAAPALLLAVLARLWISLGEAVVIASGLWWLRTRGDAQPQGEAAP